jgi:hypothetical protein
MAVYYHLPDMSPNWRLTDDQTTFHKNGFVPDGRSCRFVNRAARCACWLPSPQVQFFAEAPMAIPRQQIVCLQCEKTEEYCDCEKYCTICKGQHNIRLCADGLYYCPDCREACDVSLANDR